jgi:hypothetical protein
MEPRAAMRARWLIALKKPFHREHLVQVAQEVLESARSSE